MRLLRAELRRLFKRRFTIWMLALVVALMATVAVAVAVTHQQPGPAAVAQAERQAQREFDEQQRWMEQEIEECERAQASGGDGMHWPADCDEIRQWYPSMADLVEWNLPPSFDFRTQFPEMVYLLAGLLGLFAFIVGASFVGAEWRTGGMMNLLLWRPRRLPVLGTKLAALVGSLLGLGVLLGAGWTGAFWLVASYRGVTDSMTTGAWQSIGLTGLRGLTLVLVAGVLGFGFASIGRHTAAAMGTAIAAFVVGVGGVGLVFGAMLRVQFWEAGMWTTYLAAWMDKSVTLTDWSAPCVPGGGGPMAECEYPTLEITWQTAGIGMAAVVALVLLVAMWQMRRRDVT